MGKIVAWMKNNVTVTVFVGALGIGATMGFGLNGCSFNVAPAPNSIVNTGGTGGACWAPDTTATGAGGACWFDDATDDALPQGV